MYRMGRIDRNPMRHAGLTKKIIGVCFEVINEPGGGFLENVYHKARVLALP